MSQTFWESVRAQPWFMRVAVGGFFVGLSGVGLVFLFQYLQLRWPSYLAGSLVVLSVAVVGVSVIFGFARTVAMFIAGVRRRGGGSGGDAV